MTISDRPAVKARIVEVLAASDDLADVTVSYDFPGEAVTDKAVWFGRITGSQDQAGFAGTDDARNDRYSIEACIAVSGYETSEAADAAAQDLIVTIGALLFSGDRLGDNFRNVALYPAAVDGPNSERPNASSAYSVIEFRVDVMAPIR